MWLRCCVMSTAMGKRQSSVHHWLLLDTGTVPGVGAALEDAGTGGDTA